MVVQNGKKRRRIRISDNSRARLNDLPIEQVAVTMGFEVKGHRMICPFHEDKHPSLSFDRRTNRFLCFACGATGGTIDLVMGVLGKGFRESCMWLAWRFGMPIELTESDEPSQPLPKRVAKVTGSIPAADDERPDLGYLKRLMATPVINHYAAEFLYGERKISQEVVRRLGISSISCDTSMSAESGKGCFDGPALLIPYRDFDGRLMSVQSRYLGTAYRPRFRFPRGSKCHIYNTECLKGLDSREPVYITEGVTDCMALLSAGHNAIAIPSATLLKREDVACFRNRPLHMFPDADEPGRRLFDELKAICPQLVRHELPTGFKDVGQYYAYIHRKETFA